MSVVRLAVEPLSAREEWRPIGGYEAFAVSTFGRIKRIRPSLKNGKVGNLLKSSCGKGGYLKIALKADGHDETEWPRAFLVHRLVAEAFIGPAPDRHVVAHFDGDRLNNFLGNLRWATHLENSDDARRHGRTPAGERSGTAKLSDADVSEIRRLWSAGRSHKEICERFKISLSYSCCLCSGKNRPRRI